MTSPVDASVISTSTPIFTMIIAAIYLKEPLTFKKVGGVLLGAAGAVMLIVSGASAAAEGGGSVMGDLLCIFAELCFATYLVLFKGLISRYSPATVMKWMCLPVWRPALLSLWCSARLCAICLRLWGKSICAPPW